MMRFSFKERSDYFLFLLVILIAFLGLNVLLAATSYIASVTFHDQFYYLKKQAVFVLLGAGVMIIFSQIPYQIWEKISWPFFIFSLILLVLVFIPGVGKEAGGAKRWITVLGISVQPSDLARFGLVLVLARMYSHGEHGQQGRHNGLIKNSLALAFIGIVALLIKIEPDLGTALHTVFFSGILLLIAGYPVYILLIISIPAIPLVLISLSPYQWERIMAFLNPYKYRFESAFQLIASYKSFLSGGFWGQGLGEGLKRHNLQARHTDFIMAVIAEDLGTLGVVFFLLLYLGVFFYSAILLMKVEENFGRLLGTGIILLFITQAIMNVAVVMGLLPTTGINLPLISYGGTSVLSYMAMFGILLNILKSNKAVGNL
jgi:cell division protein FtsW